MDTQEPTIVAGIVLADHIIREAGSGKLSLIGCFSRFNLSQFPAKIDRFNIYAGITNMRGIVSKFNATCRIEMAGTGHVIGSTSAEVGITPGAPPFSPDFVFDVVFPFEGSVFFSAGIHDIVVLVDNEVIGKRQISVIQVTSQS
jgi:hypothetical protein